MVILRKLYSQPSGGNASKQEIQNIKKENDKVIKNFEQISLQNKPSVTPMGNIRPAVISAPKAPVFSNGPEMDTSTNKADDTVFDNDEDEDFD